MSTTHVQSLPNVRGRMSYTEFGEGKRRREHLENGTDRIAAQMGDAASREDFIVYCEGQKHRHPNAVNDWLTCWDMTLSGRNGGIEHGKSTVRDYAICKVQGA